MSDQQAATEQPVDSPEQGTDTEVTPQVPAGYIPEKDYKEVQAWATRDAQKAAELERQQQDPEYQAKVAKQWLEANGYTLPEEDNEDTPVYEPDPRLRQEVDELRQWKDSFTETQQKEQNYAQYREEFDPKLKQMLDGVPEQFITNVADIAYHELEPIQTPHGLQPDLEGAVAQFKEVAEMFAEVPWTRSKATQNWAKTKPKSAFTSAGGGEGTQVLDTDKHENRVAYMMARLNDGQQ